MKGIIITTLILLFSISSALAGDEPPTAESNKAAIDMVQTHADYLWTLVAAALAFWMFQVVFCANVSPLSAVIIGAVAGGIVVVSVLFFDKIKIDDPVGAISVHGVNGAWGTLAAGIFNMGGTSAKIISVQVLGIAACFLWVFPVAFVMFKLIDKTVGLRVSAEEEMEGLDFAEHGGNAYPDFEVSTYRGVGDSSGGGGNTYGEKHTGIMAPEPLKGAS